MQIDLQVIFDEITLKEFDIVNVACVPNQGDWINTPYGFRYIWKVVYDFYTSQNVSVTLYVKDSTYNRGMV